MVTHQLKPSWTWLCGWCFALKPGPVHPESSGDTSSLQLGLEGTWSFPTVMIFNHALQSPGALVESSLRLPETGRRFPITWKPVAHPPLCLLTGLPCCQDLCSCWMHSMTAPFVFRPTFALIGHCVCSGLVAVCAISIVKYFECHSCLQASLLCRARMPHTSCIPTWTHRQPPACEP